MTVLGRAGKTNRFLVGPASGMLRFVLDLSAGTRERIDVREALKPGDRFLEMGFVTGTDEVYVDFESSSDSKQGIRNYQLNAGGHLSSHVEWLSDGRPVLVLGEKENRKIRLRVGSDPVEVDFGRLASLEDIMPHPTRALAGFIFVTQNGRDVIWYDLVARRISERVSLPGKNQVKLSQDGNQLHTSDLSGAPLPALLCLTAFLP